MTSEMVHLLPRDPQTQKDFTSKPFQENRDEIQWVQTPSHEVSQTLGSPDPCSMKLLNSNGPGLSSERQELHLPGDPGRCLGQGIPAVSSHTAQDYGITTYLGKSGILLSKASILQLDLYGDTCTEPYGFQWSSQVPHIWLWQYERGLT